MDLLKFIQKINDMVPWSGEQKFDEPMKDHTSFKTGGPADLLVKPDKAVFCDWTAALLKEARAESIPVFVLGAGANLLVSDRGIRGIVLDTGAWEGVMPEDGQIKALSGTVIDNLTDVLAEKGLSGLEFLAGMPGSVGGAVYMNARCYGKSVSDALVETEILDENFNVTVVPFDAKDFSYKKSPFRNRDILILSTVFRVSPSSKDDIKSEMKKNQKDREEKGHYRYPSAGSVFKNNRDFGEPTGKIIADLGLRGLQKGGAAIAPWHGNIIINMGNAASSDIRFLMEEAANRVKKELGLDLEPEIILIGEW